MVWFYRSTEDMTKLHSDCVLLRRILDKRLKQNADDFAVIDTALHSVQGNDRQLVESFKEKLREKREKDLSFITEYVDEMKAFLNEMYPSVSESSVCGKHVSKRTTSPSPSSFSSGWLPRGQW